MKTPKAQSIKQQLLLILHEMLDLKISNASQASKLAEESKNSETKSSAGDKFETGRAMMQMEQEKSKLQLANVIKLKNTLSQLDPSIALNEVQFGSIVYANTGKYFISIGLGKVVLKDEVFFAVSVDSPISQALFGAIEGEQIRFQDKTVKVFRIA